MDINQLLESTSPASSYLKETRKLVKKWEPTGLLDGEDLKNSSYGKERMAQILENQAKQLLKESLTQTGTGATFIAGQGEQWAGVALPIVRKLFAEITAKEFLSVQPIKVASGLVYYLEFKYGSNQPFGASRFGQGDSMYGTTNLRNTYSFGGLYGAGRFGYSINEYSASINYAVTTASYADVNFNSRYSASAAAGQLIKLSVVSASAVLPNLDTTSVRAFVITGSGGISENTVFAEFTNYASASGGGIVSFISTGSNAVGSGSAAVWYQIQTQDNNRGDFEDRNNRPITGSAAIPEVDIDFRSETITAKSRKLKAKWTPEAAEDIDAYQSIDVEAELTATISDYVAVEIDLELIDMLIGAANQTTDVWSARSNRFFNKETGLFYDAAAGAGGYYNSQGEWFATLGTKLQSVGRKIHQKTLRGQANVFMCSPSVSTIIESIPGYAPDTSGDKETYAFGSQKMGMINNRYKVIVNPYMTENIILTAYKGSSYVDSGAVYAPYIPLIMTPVIYDPETFTPRKGLRTRYGKKVLREEFFGKIFVTDLEAF